MESRNIPRQIKLAVRKEANFGCVICGCPIIEYHHIVPYAKVKEHKFENLVALCPNHHTEAGNWAILPEMIYEYKKSPYNRSKELITGNFMISSYSKLKLLIGTNTYSRCNNIITCGGETLLSIRPTKNDYTLINAKFYEKDKLLAEIKDNEWRAYQGKDLWDVEYSTGKSLKINRAHRDILLHFEMDNLKNVIELKASMQYKEYLIKMSPSQFYVESLGKEVPTGIASRNCEFYDFKSIFEVV